MKVAQTVGLTVGCFVAFVLLVASIMALMVVKLCVIRLKSTNSVHRFKDFELGLATNDDDDNQEANEVFQENEPMSEANQQMEKAIKAMKSLKDSVEDFSNDKIFDMVRTNSRSTERLSKVRFIDYCGEKLLNSEVLDQSTRRLHAHYFKLYNRALAVQAIAQGAVNGSKGIREVQDRHSSGLIKIGGVVMVRDYFFGCKHDMEFDGLIPGELLKVAKFYIKSRTCEDAVITAEEFGNICEQGPSCTPPKPLMSEEHLMKKGLISPCPSLEPGVVTSEDSLYPYIWCSGVHLKSRVCRNNETGEVEIVPSGCGSTEYFESLRDFPLCSVTVGFDVPKQVSPFLKPLAVDVEGSSFETRVSKEKRCSSKETRDDSSRSIVSSGSKTRDSLESSDQTSEVDYKP